MPTNIHIMYSALDNAYNQEQICTAWHPYSIFINSANTKTETAQTINEIRLTYTRVESMLKDREAADSFCCWCVNGGHQPHWSVCLVHFIFQRVLSCCVYERRRVYLCALFHTCFVSVCCACLLVKQECTIYVNKKTEKTAKQLDQYFKKTAVLKPL